MGTREDSAETTTVWAALRALIDGGDPQGAPDAELARAAIEGEVAALTADLRPGLAPRLAPIIEREVFVALQLDRALLAAVEALAEEQVPEPVIVKGQAAARQVYLNPCHRIGVDIDLLVHERDFDRTLEVLRAAGFRSATSASLIQRHGPRPWEEELAWVTSGGSVSLDVHRKIAASDRFRVDHEGMLGRAVSHPELPWRLSHPEDTLLHTALHMAVNRFWVPLKSWVDVRRLLDHEDVNLERLFERARRWKMRTSLWAVLFVCGRWFPGSISEAALRDLQPGPLTRRALCAGLAHDGHRPIGGDPKGLRSQLLYGPLLSDDLSAVARWMGESARQAQRMASASKPR